MEGRKRGSSQLDGDVLLAKRGVSQSMVATALQAQTDGTSTSHRQVRRCFDRSADDLYARIGTTIDLPLCSGETFHWEIASPQELMKYHVGDSPFLQQQLVYNNNSTPWSICFYHDEVTPGNLKAPDNRRKYTSFRFTFKEFGWIYMLFLSVS